MNEHQLGVKIRMALFMAEFRKLEADLSGKQCDEIFKVIEERAFEYQAEKTSYESVKNEANYAKQD